MAAPALEKNYNFDVQNIHLSTGSFLEDSQTVLLAIKNALVATGGWTVTGSHDGAGTLGNNDNVDRWTDVNDLVFDYTGNKSWIVLEQNSINTHTQICFWLKTAQYYTDGTGMTVTFSPSAGFGAAYGGTDGTTSGRPTATDESILIDSSINGQTWFSPQSNPFNCAWHMACSTDGEVTFLNMCYGGATTACMMIQKPKNPLAEWTDPAVAYYLGGSDSGPRYSKLNDASNIHGYVSGFGPIAMRAATEMAISSMIGQYQTQPNIEGEYPLTAISLRGTTAGARGHLGMLYDIRFAPSARADGNTYPGPGDVVPESTWVQFQDCVFPWDASTPVLLG